MRVGAEKRFVKISQRIKVKFRLGVPLDRIHHHRSHLSHLGGYVAWDQLPAIYVPLLPVRPMHILKLVCIYGTFVLLVLF